MKTKLERLKEEIARIEVMQRDCNHEWGEPYVEMIKEPIYETSYRGSDCYPSMVGYKDVETWVRICKKCEKKETTREIGEIAVKTRKGPIFK